MYAMIGAFPIINMSLNTNYRLSNGFDSSCVRKKTTKLNTAGEAATDFRQQDVEVVGNLFAAQAVSEFPQPAVAGAA